MSHYTVLVRITQARLKASEGDVEAALAEMLEPFEESPEAGSKYLVFEDETDGYKKEYETETLERVRMPDGSTVSPSDERFRVPGPFGSPSQRPPKERLVEVPFSEVYPTFERFCEDWHGAKTNEAGRYGYFRNPNAKWDWYSIGGRWSGHFPLKSGREGVVGRPGVFGNKPEAGKVDVARKSDIDFDTVAAEGRRGAAEWFNKYITWTREPGTEWGGFSGPRDRALSIGLVRVVKGPAEAGSGEIAYPWSNSTHLKPEDDRRTWTDIIRVPTHDEFDAEFAVAFDSLKTFAALDDSGWHAPGKMGWFGMSSDTPEDYLSFARAFNEKFLKAASDDDTLVLVDCHI